MSENKRWILTINVIVMTISFIEVQLKLIDNPSLCEPLNVQYYRKPRNPSIIGYHDDISIDFQANWLKHMRGNEILGAYWADISTQFGLRSSKLSARKTPLKFSAGRFNYFYSAHRDLSKIYREFCLISMFSYF